jgi:hypothetical protein
MTDNEYHNSVRDDDPNDDYYSDGHGYDCDCAECTFEHNASQCGLLPDHLGGGCTMAGTEFCDFECPFRDDE